MAACIYTYSTWCRTLSPHLPLSPPFEGPAASTSNESWSVSFRSSKGWVEESLDAKCSATWHRIRMGNREPVGRISAPNHKLQRGQYRPHSVGILSVCRQQSYQELQRRICFRPQNRGRRLVQRHCQKKIHSVVVISERNASLIPNQCFTTLKKM